MKSKRDLAQEQLDLMEIIRGKSNINMVTCGNCGTILLHEMKSIHEDNHDITCFGCKQEMDFSDCPDYWYVGCIEGAEFDEDVNLDVTVDDVVKVAMDLGMNPSIAEINEVLKYYNSEAENDSTATWELIVENLLYNFVGTL
jgi:hypothetical protein